MDQTQEKSPITEYEPWKRNITAVDGNVVETITIGGVTSTIWYHPREVDALVQALRNSAREAQCQQVIRST